MFKATINVLDENSWKGANGMTVILTHSESKPDGYELVRCPENDKLVEFISRNGFAPASGFYHHPKGNDRLGIPHNCVILSDRDNQSLSYLLNTDNPY